MIDTGAGFLLEETDEVKKPVKLIHKPGEKIIKDEY